MPIASKRLVPPRSNDGHSHGSTDGDFRPTKRQRKQLYHKLQQYKLTTEQEKRLGKACDTATWLIRIAQSTSERVCLMVRSINASKMEADKWTLNVETNDRLSLTMILAGSWVRDISAHFQHNGKVVQDHPFLISSFGASLQAFRDTVTFATGDLALHILDVSDIDLGQAHTLQPAWLEEVSKSTPMKSSFRDENEQASVQDDQVASPSLSSDLRQNLPVGFTVEQKAQRDSSASIPPSATSDGNAREIDKVDDSYTSEQAREAPSSPSSWLETPLQSPDVKQRPFVKSKNTANRAVMEETYEHNENFRQQEVCEDDEDPDDDVYDFDQPLRQACSGGIIERRALTERQIDSLVFTPVKMLEINKSKTVCTIGLIDSAGTAYRASGGNRDWTLKIVLQDVFPLGGSGSLISCNLFAPDYSTLPVCKVNDVLALAHFKVREFGGNRQGTGFSGQFAWTLLSGETGAISRSTNVTLSVEVEKELLVQHSFLKNGHAQHLNPVKRYSRKLIPIKDIEPSVFFDTDVQVLKVWRGFQPCLSVTDWTHHRQLYPAHDENLPGVPPKGPNDTHNAVSKYAEGGHVLRIFLWTENLQATEMAQVHEGMFVRLENVRPKISSKGFLEGNMEPISGLQGDGSQSNRFRVRELDPEDETVLQIKDNCRDYKIKMRSGHGSLATSSSSASSRKENSSCEKDGGRHTPLRRDKIPLSERQEQSSNHAWSDFDSFLNGDDDDSCERRGPQRPMQSSRQRPRLTELDKETKDWGITHLRNAVGFEGEDSFRCRVICTGKEKVRPPRLRDWVTVTCSKCRKILPRAQTACQRCGEMSSSAFHYEFRLAIMVKDASQEEVLVPSERGREQDPAAIYLAGDEARAFFAPFDPREVREREKTRMQLANRMVAFLGGDAVHEALQEHDYDRSVLRMSEEERGKAPAAFDVIVKTSYGGQRTQRRLTACQTRMVDHK